MERVAGIDCRHGMSAGIERGDTRACGDAGSRIDGDGIVEGHAVHQELDRACGGRRAGHDRGEVNPLAIGRGAG